jgi:hypothetical protein
MIADREVGRVGEATDAKKATVPGVTALEIMTMCVQ